MHILITGKERRMTTQAEDLAAAITDAAHILARALEGRQAPEKAPRTAEATPGAARLTEAQRAALKLAIYTAADDDTKAGVMQDLLAALEPLIASWLADAWDAGYYRGVRDEAVDIEPADNPWRSA